MAEYYHAHRIDPDECNGCMICMRQCPTEAIRVRDGKATYSNELCVDCGECLSVCPTGAVKLTYEDPMGELDQF